MFRAYARFGVVVQLMAALLAGIGAQCLWQSGSRARRMACVVLVALTAGEYAVWPPALSRDVLPTSAHRWVMRPALPIRALDCAPLTPESESVTWLSGYRVALGGGWFDDCAEPNFADKLASGGYTHLIVRRSTSEGSWFASHAYAGRHAHARHTLPTARCSRSPRPRHSSTRPAMTRVLSARVRRGLDMAMDGRRSGLENCRTRATAAARRGGRHRDDAPFTVPRSADSAPRRHRTIQRALVPVERGHLSDRSLSC